MHDAAKKQVKEETLAAIEAMEGLPYLGEAISQREHALQTAYQLRLDGASDQLIVAGVIHDIGRAPGVVVVGEPHEVTGARWCEERFGSHVAGVVGAHVPAKRVLVATDATYQGQLSSTSVATLRVQGGPATSEEVAAFQALPWAQDALALRRADDRAKVVGAPGLSLDEVAALLDQVLEGR